MFKKKKKRIFFAVYCGATKKSHVTMKFIGKKVDHEYPANDKIACRIQKVSMNSPDAAIIPKSNGDAALTNGIGDFVA